jgi:hypothetical protein
LISVQASSLKEIKKYMNSYGPNRGVNMQRWLVLILAFGSSIWGQVIEESTLPEIDSSIVVDSSSRHFDAKPIVVHKEAPTALQANSPALTTAGRMPPEHHNTGGFAIASAITGFVLSPIMLGLTIEAAATSGNGLVPALPLGASALGIGVVSVSILASGGNSARSSDKVNGEPDLRIGGYTGYGISLGCGALMCAVALYGGTIPTGAIIGCGLLASISCLFLSVDNLISGAQARRYYADCQESSASGPELTFSIGPYRNNGVTMQVGIKY